MCFSLSPLSKFSVLLSSLLVLAPGAPLYTQNLLVAAASDLAPLQEPLRQQNVRFTFGASGMLAKQIENGAPFDIFMSASEEYVTNLAAKGKIDPATVVVYARGRLGLWSKSGRVQALPQLADPSVLRISIANPAHAPYGAAAKELLERKGLWETLQPKIVYAENVRQALQYAESGNVDATLTAWSLLYDKGAVRLPEDHKPIQQAAGVVKDSPRAAQARAFLEYLHSSTGRKILEAHGLIPSSDIPQESMEAKRP